MLLIQCSTCLAVRLGAWKKQGGRGELHPKGTKMRLKKRSDTDTSTDKDGYFRSEDISKGAPKGRRCTRRGNFWRPACWIFREVRSGCTYGLYGSTLSHRWWILSLDSFKQINIYLTQPSKMLVHNMPRRHISALVPCFVVQTQFRSTPTQLRPVMPPRRQGEPRMCVRTYFCGGYLSP